MDELWTPNMMESLDLYREFWLNCLEYGIQFKLIRGKTIFLLKSKEIEKKPNLSLALR